MVHREQDPHKQAHPLLAAQCRQIYYTQNLSAGVWSRLQYAHIVRAVVEFPLLSLPEKRQALNAQ